MTDETMDTSINSEEDEETVELTASEILRLLEKAWVNEKLTPELLNPLTDEVDMIIEQLKAIQRNLSRMDRKDPRHYIHKMEIERVKYLVQSYLKIRLQKIQEHCWFFNELEKSTLASQRRLMPKEQEFLKEYVQLMDNEIKTLALDKMPASMQKFDLKRHITKPNLDVFVFINVEKDIGNILVEDASGEQEEVTLSQGSRHIIRYRIVDKWVKNGDISLI